MPLHLMLKIVQYLQQYNLKGRVLTLIWLTRPTFKVFLGFLNHDIQLGDAYFYNPVSEILVSDL